MKFSVVTISFNQAEFLERTFESVFAQTGVDLEYIVVDPGSTDGSRDIIERYRHRIAHVILERDAGPADGLNKGFAVASGDIYCYLNSDDTFAPGALLAVAKCFGERPAADVLCGHAWIIDSRDRVLRRVWSDPPRYWQLAYGMAIQIQPSTFIRARAFKKTEGFNVGNRSNWDGELLVDLILDGARIEILNEFVSNYRLHNVSITGTGSLQKNIDEWSARRFQKLAKRNWGLGDNQLRLFWWSFRQLRNPLAAFERMRHGSVYRRMAAL